MVICCLGLTLNTSAQSQRKTDSLDKVINTAKDPKDIVDALNEKSRSIINIDLTKGLSQAKRAYQLSDQNGYSKGKQIACINLALIYYFKSDLDKAMQYATEGKNIAEHLGLEQSLAVSLDAIGVIYYEIGDKKKSSEYFFQSLKIYEKLNDKNGLGQTFCRIGTLYFDQNDYDKALEYYAHSVKLAKEIKSREGIASNLNNLAKVYAEKKEYSKSLENYMEALQINTEMGNLQLEGSNYLNIASVYSKQDNYSTALYYIQKAYTVFIKIGNQLRIAKCQIRLAEIYLKTSQYNNGLQNANAALRLAQEQGYHEVIYDAAKILHEIYLVKQDTGSAYKFYLLENKWKDSLSYGENQKTLTKLELQYQFEKNEQKEKIKQQRKTVIIAIVILCLVFSIIIIVFILNHIRLKAKKTHLEKIGLEKELTFKKKELTLNVMSLMKKNELLATISEKLMKTAKEETSVETKSAIKKLGRELQKSQEDELWKEFTVRFKEVHSEFYTSLLTKFPDLTPNEQKLCAFLRLNMTTKEISELTGKSISTTEIARHRLRQKLGISNSEVNLVTFLSQL